MLRYETKIPKLTKNDQKVLKRIIEQAKITDLGIAEQIGVSPQAIFKIRHKLERLGVIKGYMPIIDFKKIGIQYMVVMGVKFTPYMWEKYTDIELSQRIQDIPEVLTAYRISGSGVSHILIIGFKDTYTKDKYLMNLESKYSKHMEIVSVHSCSVESIIKSSPIGLLHSILDQKQPSTNEFFSE